MVRENTLSSLSPTPQNTAVWISRLGESDVAHWVEKKDKSLFLLRDFWVRCISHRTLSVWTPSQYEDLTFQLFRSDFIQSGSVQFFNPPSPSEYEVMRPNPISMESNTIRVGLGTTVTDTGILVGNLVTQENTNLSGRFVGYGGSCNRNTHTDKCWYWIYTYLWWTLYLLWYRSHIPDW